MHGHETSRNETRFKETKLSVPTRHAFGLVSLSKNKYGQLPFYTDHSTALDQPLAEIDHEDGSSSMEPECNWSIAASAMMTIAASADDTKRTASLKFFTRRLGESHLLQDFSLVRVARDIHKCLMDLATCCDRICYTLWDAPRQTTSRKRWHHSFSFHLASKWVNFKRFLERTSDLLQNPMQSIADFESKRPQLEREFREREKFRVKETEQAPTVQLSVTTEHRFLRHMVQGRASCG